MPTTAQRGSETRERLLAAAVRLIPELGWDNVSTRQVAEAAGVNAGLVHYHFGSVQALRVAAVSSILDEVSAQYEPLLASADDPGTLATGLVEMITTFSHDDPMMVLLWESFAAASRDTDLREVMGRALADWRSLLADYLHDRRVPDADARATLASALIDGLFLHVALSPELDPTAWSGPLAELLTGGTR